MLCREVLCCLLLPGTTALESPLPKAAKCSRRCEFIRTQQEPYRFLESLGGRLRSNTHGAQVNSCGRTGPVAPSELFGVGLMRRRTRSPRKRQGRGCKPRPAGGVSGRIPYRAQVNSTLQTLDLWTNCLRNIRFKENACFAASDQS
jgi:hypothetical protein